MTTPETGTGGLVNQPTAKPSRKVSLSGVGGAFAIVIVWAVHAFTEVEVEPEVAAAFGVLASIAVAYFVRERA